MVLYSHYTLLSRDVDHVKKTYSLEFPDPKSAIAYHNILYSGLHETYELRLKVYNILKAFPSHSKLETRLGWPTTKTGAIEAHNTTCMSLSIRDVA